MVQTVKRTRKQRIDAAISYALDRRWDLAATENQALIAEFPDDMEAANRLGKALTEIGDLDGAAAAYQRTLDLDSTNVIARRNLTRIEELRGAPGAGKRRAPRLPTASATTTARTETVRAHSLIEESGKSAEFYLVDPDARGLQRVTPGEPAELVPTPRGISVRSSSGAVLGHMEPGAGLRLRRLIEGGNRYAAVIRRVGEDDASIYVRETYRDPSLVGQPSFLPPASSSRKRLAPRAYTKASIVRYQADGEPAEDGEDDDGAGSWAPRAASRRGEEDEFEESGFSDDSSISDDDDEADEIVVDDDEDM